MSKNALRRKVEKRLSDACAASMTFNVPLEFENVRFLQDENTYASVHILDGKSFKTELKNRAVVRVPGILQIDCLAPEDETSTFLDQLSSFVGKLFERQTFTLEDQSRVVFNTFSEHYLGKSEGRCRNVVTVPFYRDEPPKEPGT